MYLTPPAIEPAVAAVRAYLGRARASPSPTSTARSWSTLPWRAGSRPTWSRVRASRSVSGGPPRSCRGGSRPEASRSGRTESTRSSPRACFRSATRSTSARAATTSRWRRAPTGEELREGRLLPRQRRRHRLARRSRANEEGLGRTAERPPLVEQLALGEPIPVGASVRAHAHTDHSPSGARANRRPSGPDSRTLKAFGSSGDRPPLSASTKMIVRSTGVVRSPRTADARPAPRADRQRRPSGPRPSARPRPCGTRARYEKRKFVRRRAVGWGHDVAAAPAVTPMASVRNRRPKARATSTPSASRVASIRCACRPPSRDALHLERPLDWHGPQEFDHEPREAKRVHLRLRSGNGAREERRRGPAVLVCIIPGTSREQGRAQELAVAHEERLGDVAHWGDPGWQARPYDTRAPGMVADGLLRVRRSSVRRGPCSSLMGRCGQVSSKPRKCYAVHGTSKQPLQQHRHRRRTHAGDEKRAWS